MIAEHGARTVAFGHWAGIAGAINGLSLMGTRLLSLGHNTPLIRVNMANGYLNSTEAMDLLKECGDEIRQGVLSDVLEPLVFTVTGSGRVAQGAAQVLNALGVTWVAPDQLATLDKNNSTVYATIVEPHHHLTHPNSKFSNPVVGSEAWEYFLSHNTEYKSNFAENIAPFTSMLINCLYWSPGDPKILTNDQVDNLINSETRKSEFPGVPYLPQKLLVVSDISADTNGSLEFVKSCTTMDKPFENVWPERGDSIECQLAPGLMVTSIDYLPGSGYFKLV